MDKDSKYRPVLDKVQSQIMKAEIGVTGVYQVMLETLGEAETAELALREELAALRAENAKLNSVVCQTCHGAGSVCSAPDDCYNCPECVATDNKVRADAIRDMLTCIDGAIENDFISMREVDEMTLDDFFTLANKHANQIEAGL
tara:strand:+ start:2235 stop:2666 length:432 start_codon:yes stop_codon:yes gene_type:complete